MRLTDEQISNIRYEEGYHMGVQETAYLIFKDLYSSCIHDRLKLKLYCSKCMVKLKKKWLNE